MTDKDVLDERGHVIPGVYIGEGDAPMSGITDESSSEDDPVIKEYDVCASQMLAKYLHIFQFPVHPAARGLTSTPRATRIKPNAGVIEIDMPVDTKRPVYDTQRGMELGCSMAGKRYMDYAGDGGSGRSCPQFDTLTLCSTRVPQHACYAAGYIKNGQLHLTPVANTLQFRPSLKYLDRIDDLERASHKAALDDEASDNPTDRENNDHPMRTLQVQVKSTDMNWPNAAVTAGPNSIQLLKQVSEELWTRLQYFDVDVSWRRRMSSIIH